MKEKYCSPKMFLQTVDSRDILTKSPAGTDNLGSFGSNWTKLDSGVSTARMGEKD